MLAQPEPCFRALKDALTRDRSHDCGLRVGNSRSAGLVLVFRSRVGEANMYHSSVEAKCQETIHAQTARTGRLRQRANAVNASALEPIRTSTRWSRFAGFAREMDSAQLAAELGAKNGPVPISTAALNAGDI
jgi:hypothetical protein